MRIRRWKDDVFVAESDLGAALAAPGWVWVQLEEPDPEALAGVGELAGVDLGRLVQELRRDFRPRAEVRETFVQATAIAVGWDPASLDVRRAPFAAVLGARVLVTVALEPVPVLDPDEERVHEHAGHGPAGLLHVILDDLVEAYFDVSEALEDAIDDVIDLAIDGKDASRTLQVRLRQQLLQFRRAALPLREVLSLVTRLDAQLVSPEAKMLLLETYEHVLRVSEQVDLNRDLLVAAHEAFQAALNARMSLVMKKTSSWGAILLVPTLVAGCYGMNFDNMPELGQPLGYYWTVGIMVGLMVGLYVYFKRKEYL